MDTKSLHKQTLLLEEKKKFVLWWFLILQNEFREIRLEREKRQAVVIIIYIPPSQNYESIYASKNEEYQNVNDKPFCRDISDRVLHF